MATANFKFDVGQDRLAVELTPLGNEFVYLNGRLLRQSRRYKLKTSYSVNIGDSVYKLDIRVGNPLTGRIECQLSVDGVVVDAQYTTAKLSEKNKSLSGVLLLISCGLLGALIPVMGSWVWLSPLLFVLCVAISLAGRERIYPIHRKSG
ncbi:hypothetical protein FHR99_003228 [Litorivivens lipolytica]|uniref:Uncharacterized protein n=1 Tax=Litorivivens lipolytica TaxID=1524264 RepID=A0A7W4W7N7_9GAMM|nr:hypothetical protein [Litorivivens lipolytica]